MRAPIDSSLFVKVFFELGSGARGWPVDEAGLES